MPDATPTISADAVQNLVTPDGALVGMPAAHVADALAQGFRPPTPDEMATFERQAKLQSPIEGLKAFGEGAASALTLGLAPKIEQSAFGANPADIAARKAAWPVAHGAGELLGVAAPLLLTWGASAPVEGAALGAEGAAAAARATPGIVDALRGAAEFTGPGLIAKAGKAAQAAVEGAEIPGIAGRVLPGMAEAATAGGLYGAQDAVERHFLGDPDLTWEKAAAEIGVSALVPSVLMGGAKLLGEAVKPWADTLIAKGKSASETRALLEAQKEEAQAAGSLGGTASDAFRKYKDLRDILLDPTSTPENKAAAQDFLTSLEGSALRDAAQSATLERAPELAAEYAGKKAAYAELMEQQPGRVAERAAQLSDPARLGELLNDRVFKRYILKRAIPGWIVGSMTGVGGPVGTLTGISYGYASDVVKRILKDPSMFMALGQFLRSPLETFSALTGLSKLAGTTDSAIASRVGAIFSGEAAAAGSAAGRAVTPDNFTHVAGDLQDAARNPGRLADDTIQQAGSLADLAPASTQALYGLAARGVQHLASQLPSGPTPLPLSPPHRPSAAELAPYNRAHEIATAPLRLLDHVAAGTLDSAHVQAADAIWPKLTQDMRAKVTEGLAAHVAAGKTVPRKVRLALSMFLGSDLDPSTAQATIASNQATFATAPKSATPGAVSGPVGRSGGGRARAIKVSAQYATPAQRMQERGSEPI